MKDYIQITTEQRNRLIKFEQKRDCRIPVGFADSYEPSDDCYHVGGDIWQISRGGYQLASNRGFKWTQADDWSIPNPLPQGCEKNRV